MYCVEVLTLWLVDPGIGQLFQCRHLSPCLEILLHCVSRGQAWHLLPGLQGLTWARDSLAGWWGMGGSSLDVKDDVS